MDTGKLFANPRTISAVRRELINVNEKIDSINERVNLMNLGLSPVPEKMMNVEDSLTEKSQKMMELEERNKLHSAKLKLLQKEVNYEKMRHEMLMDYLKAKEEYPSNNNTGYTNTGDLGYHQNGGDTTKNDYDTAQQQTPMSPRRDQAYSPRQPNPVEAKQASRQPSPRAEWRDPYEQRLLDEDPKNRQYAMADSQKKSVKPFNFEEMQKQRRKEIYSVYDSTAINPQFYEDKPQHRKYPWFDHETHPYPGGFLFMRFDDSGYDSVNVALKSQQSICRNAGGYLMGMARKQRIFLFEVAQTNKQQNWFISRNQPYDDVMMTENAIAAFWFTKKEAAENFFENCHHNRFREPCFPTPRGYEAFYVPLQMSPSMRPYNTFLFIEVILNAAKKNALEENMTQFEAELRNDMSRVVPGCQPMVVSSSSGRVVFKPGLFVSPYSKLFISRFESQRDVDQIWKMGMIQGLRQKWGLAGEMNIFSMTIDDAF